MQHLYELCGIKLTSTPDDILETAQPVSGEKRGVLARRSHSSSGLGAGARESGNVIWSRGEVWEVRGGR